MILKFILKYIKYQRETIWTTTIPSLRFCFFFKWFKFLFFIRKHPSFPKLILVLFNFIRFLVFLAPEMLENSCGTKKKFLVIGSKYSNELNPFISLYFFFPSHRIQDLNILDLFKKKLFLFKEKKNFLGNSQLDTTKKNHWPLK